MARREDVLNALSQIARTFRTRVGESLSTVERHSTPLEATTPSLDALKAYSAGVNAALFSGNAAAIPFYRRAVEIDPQFAMAQAMLGLSYSAVGESVLSAESTARAWQLRDRVSDREKFLIDFNYDRQVTGNLDKAYQTLELWLQTYPRGNGEPKPEQLLGGLATHGTGRFGIAIEAAQKGIAADPDQTLSYGSLAGSYFFTDRFPEAERTLQRAFERKLELPDFLVVQYNIAVLTSEQAHRGIVGLDPIGTQAHLQLGRTFALSGDLARSKTAYQEFLTLWKDADPDVPILTQAQAEYARLP